MRQETHPTYAALRKRFGVANFIERKRMVEDGAAFASFSVMTPIEDAEKTFRRWREAGRPFRLAGISQQLRSTREKRLASVHSLAYGQVEELAMVGSPRAELRFWSLAWGYGPAKSCFALALAGIGHLACIDRRIARKYGYRPEDLDRWGPYMEAVERIYPGVEDSASAQAFEWFKDLAAERYETQHEVMFGMPSPQLAMEFAR